MPGHDGSRHDLVLVGGGLANGLIAYRLRQLRPDLDILLVEASAEGLGGNHTWSFHESDLGPGQLDWLSPFVSHRWPGYQVCFPEFGRRIGLGYATIFSTRFHDVLAAALEGRIRLGARVESVGQHEVVFADGSVVRAGAVIDGRGFAGSRALVLGFQKFVGLEVECDGAGGLTEPIIMDATVPQHDGYRFVYVLPLAADRLLIEDTTYSDRPALDIPLLRGRVLAYAADRGWSPRRVLRQETGVLPVALDGDIEAYWNQGPAGVARSGLRAGLFHATTGYSLPEAVRLADHICAAPIADAAAFAAGIRGYAVSHWRRQEFFRLLNRLLFRAGRPEDRHRIMARFYRLPEPLIARFYAGELQWRDRVRLLVGRPPVPIAGAVRVVLGAARAS